MKKKRYLSSVCLNGTAYQTFNVVVQLITAKITILLYRAKTITMLLKLNVFYLLYFVSSLVRSVNIESSYIGKPFYVVCSIFAGLNCLSLVIVNKVEVFYKFADIEVVY